MDNKISNRDKTGESKRKSVTCGPTLGWYKGAVVFARAMFQKCSVFTSQFQTEDQEGRKHLLPVEEVHFQKQTQTYTVGQAGLLHTQVCTRAERFVKTEEFFI